MKLNFCTLFNSNYLSRGMVMFESLKQQSNNFHLYVFAFDDKCFEYLNAQKDEHLTVISLKEFEDEKLLNIKSTRTATEYCWTCTPSTILYCIKKYSLDNCTYIDADLFFYSDPRILIDEMKNNSVLITAHRYTAVYDQSKVSGKYCVQFVTFKNYERGLKVLNWWRDACIEWCYAKVEGGKFGDQKYLDEWTTRFEGVHELQHLGGGVAPWNVQQYHFHNSSGKISGTEISSGKNFELVFFHFHGVKYFEDEIVLLTSSFYKMDSHILNQIYKPYIRLLNESKNKIQNTDSSFDPNGASGKSPLPPMNMKLLLKFYLHDISVSIKNIFGTSLRNRIAHHYYFKSNSF